MSCGCKASTKEDKGKGSGSRAGGLSGLLLRSLVYTILGKRTQFKFLNSNPAIVPVQRGLEALRFSGVNSSGVQGLGCNAGGLGCLKHVFGSINWDPTENDH